MKIFILPLMLFFSSMAWATPVLISNVCTGNTSGGTGTVTTSAINTTGATLEVITIGYAASRVPINDPTDSSSNTWTTVNTTSSAGDQALTIYYNSNPTTSSSQTFTVSQSSSFVGICVMAFSGTVVSSVYDVQNSATTGSSVSSLQTGSITPSQNGELIISGSSSNNSGTTFSVNSSLTIPTGGQLPGVGSQYFGTAAAYLIQSTATPINPTWSVSPNSPMTASIVAFKVPANTVSTGYLTVQGRFTVKNGGLTVK